MRSYEFIWCDEANETSIIIAASTFSAALVKGVGIMSKPDPENKGRKRVVSLKEWGTDA